MLLEECKYFRVACHGYSQGTVQEEETISNEMEESVLQEDSLLELGGTFLERYQEVFVRENAKKAALVYLDEEVKALEMPDMEIQANAYGFIYDFEDYKYQTFYWFEYVPYKGLIRVHSGKEQERQDYYLRYTGDSFETELTAKSIEYTWLTYVGEKEVSNEEFLGQRTVLGYDELISCDYLFDDIEAAYENIDMISDTKKVLEDFVNGKRDALDYVDFDNDGEEELIIHGYCGACYFFDVVGDTVYKVLETGSATDVAYVAEWEGKKVIARTDLTHMGRKSYRIMTYDACCCLIDWCHLYAGYEGETYSADDEFLYRNRK